MPRLNHFLDDWGPTLVAAAAATFVAVTGALLTTIGPWYRSLRKPSWQPPDWLFGPAWTLIFILEAASGVIGWHHVPHDSWMALLLVLYALNGFFNIYWSVLFFRNRRPDHALREVPFLWLSVVGIMIVLAIFTGPTWLFMLPYLLWVSFAAFLNYTIVRLNEPFGA
jgi:tryptophan-rich sensory protein